MHLPCLKRLGSFDKPKSRLHDEIDSGVGNDREDQPWIFLLTDEGAIDGPRGSMVTITK